MKLDPKTVSELAVAFRPTSYLRVMPLQYKATPLGMGFGQTRFSSPTRAFQLAYIAKDVSTSIAETIVRDRFEGTAARVLDESEIEDWAMAEINATEPLLVLDLRTAGLLKLGVSTDAARAKDHRDGRILSEELYRSYDIDGLLYASRLTGAECVAVYDRAVTAKLASGPVVELVRHGELDSALRSIGVTLRRGS